MANNTGLLIAGVLGLFWLLSRKPAAVPGGVTVTGNLGPVAVSSGSRMGQARMGSHQVQKGPNDKVVVAATYSVAAQKPDNTFVSWPYKFFIRAGKGATTLYSDMSPEIVLPKSDNQIWAGAGFGFSSIPPNWWKGTW